MSFLEMKKAPIPDMSSGIISFWFRDITKRPDGLGKPAQPVPNNPPHATVWPQGFWTEANASTVMVPPNAQYSIGSDPAFKNSVLFYNPYGLPIGSFYFGDAFLGAACVWIPNSPPVPLNTMSSLINPAMGAVADVDMSKYGIRMLLAFGDPNIDYNYCTWRRENPPVIDAVQYADSAGFVIYNNPPPYRPYYFGLGDNGKFDVANYRINPPTTKFKVPQSFIGIDNDGHIVINLQTQTKAAYEGMSFELHNMKEMWGSSTSWIVDGPPYSYSQIGFPFPDGHWESQEGYWNGYQWEYKDISTEIMGCAPESFVIYAATHFLNFAPGAPMVYDGGWHHLLFSFNISGSVMVDQSDGANPIGTSTCKAWLALDDVNIKGVDLQNRPPTHDGFILPKLRGAQTSQILDCGPCTTFDRSTINLVDDNAILPRNAWVRGFGGNPKDNLLNYVADVGIIGDGDDFYSATGRLWGGEVGNFNWIDWTGSIWPLFGHGVSPGPWQATYDPEKPPDPPDLAAPKYSCSEFSIPVNGHPIGIPVSSGLVDYNTGVEMAELQIWANKSLDTNKEEMRRLFLGYPMDENGKPDRSKSLQPVSPSEAESKLGKPDVLLHGSSNWQTGKNTGTAGIDATTGKLKPEGQFVPTARIETFKTEPELGV